jgi:hypothetical protein
MPSGSDVLSRLAFLHQLARAVSNVRVLAGACALALGATSSSCTNAPAPTNPADLPDHRSVGFHGDRRKLGWVDVELGLPARLVGNGFGVAWESPPFDDATIDGKTYPPLAYASPLFARDVRTGRGISDVVYAATSSGFVYGVFAPRAVATTDPSGIKPGEFLFSTKLVTPASIPRLDGGVAIGVLSTPVLDVDAMRLYVVAYDAQLGWLAFGLSAIDGSILAGWPIPIDQSTIGGVNANGPSIGAALFPAPASAEQRSALALSPSGDRLYVAFGSYESITPGWIASIDTALRSRSPRIARSFSAAPSAEPKGNGGMSGAGGLAIDPSGRLWVTTGSSPAESKDTPRIWGSSLLVLNRELGIEATYTPYNYCKLDANNLDLSASGPILVPNLTPTQTSTPQLVGFGSEQGNVYLLDRNLLPGDLARRPPCGTNPAVDPSLLPPLPQLALSARGPLNVFGPFSDDMRGGDGDFARMRSRPAYFRDGAGDHWLIVTGTYKSSVDSATSVPPGLAKVRIVLAANQPAHLERSVVNGTVTLKNPGSPVVTGENDDAVVWVLDQNAPPNQSPLDPSTPTPVLYGFAARDLSLIWQSGEGALRHTGRYGVPAIGNGQVYVATDKLTAFAPR